MTNMTTILGTPTHIFMGSLLFIIALLFYKLLDAHRKEEIDLFSKFKKKSKKIR